MTTAPARPALREVLPHPRRLLEVGPHAGAHRVAIRAGIAMGAPLAALYGTGHIELALYAVFGAFTALYGRAHSHVSRLRMQASAAVALVGAVVAGTALSALPGRAWLVVPAAALIAAGTTFLSDALDWHPPGSLFFVFAFAATASVPSRPGAMGSTVLIALALAAASAAFAMLVSTVGLARPRARRVAPTRLRVSFAAAAGRPGQARRMLTVGVAVLVAGALPTATGLGHPYWSMVAAVAALGASDAAGQLVRAGHRVLGTLVGVGLAAVLLLVGGSSTALLVLFVVLLQVAAELFVMRNYGLTMVFVTPLALIMAQLAHTLDEFGMLRDRTVETLLGAAVGIAVSLGAAHVAALRARRRARPASAETTESVLERR